MMRYICVFLLLLALGCPADAQAQAETVTFSWDNPTEYEDGRPYDAATEQAQTRIYCNLDATAFVPQTPSTSQPAIIYSRAQNDDTSTSESLFYDTYKCHATVITKLGWESRLSNSILFILGSPVPPPPPPPPEPDSLIPRAPNLNDIGV